MNNTSEESGDSVRHVGGLEGRLSFAAWTVLVLGLLAAVLLLLKSFSLGGVLPAIGVAANAWIIWLILLGLAETIRLQKKANGLAYSGEISRVEELLMKRCGTCGQILYDEHRCGACGKLVSESEKPDKSE